MRSGSEGGRASTGIRGLDDVLGGDGLPRSKLYLVTGDPGAGKTTLGLQFLLDGVRKGERAAYVVLSESARELHGLARSHGWTLDGVTVLEAEQNRDRDYSFFGPAEVELSETSRTLLNQLENLQPQRVVFDSLSEVRLLAQDPLRYRRQVMTLKRFFDERDATVMLTDFVTSDADRQLESLCHGIIDLEQLAPEYGGQRRRMRVRKLRESAFRDGYHDFVIRKGGLTVFPRLIAAEHQRRMTCELDTCSTGVPPLDDLLGGGLDRGTSTLILGPAGAGKSTLTAQYVKAALTRGERAAAFIFDEVPNTFVLRAEGLGLGLREEIASGRFDVRQVDPAELSPGQFAHLVREAVEVDGATTIVIDSINGYTSAMPEEHYLHAHLHELLAYLNQMHVVTLMVMTQQGILGQTTAPVDLSYLADTVILLRYFEARSEIRQAISIVKRRTGRHERTIRELMIDTGGVHVGEPLIDFQGVMSGNLQYTGNTLLTSRYDPGAP